MQSITFSAADVSVLKKRLENDKNNTFLPNFAFVFTSVCHDLAAITAAFDEAGIRFIGCTSAGEIIDDTLYEQEIGVMLLDLPPNSFNIFGTSFHLNDLQTAGTALGNTAQKMYDKPAIILLSAGLETDGEHLTNIIKSCLGALVCMFGGMAGDDLLLKATYVFSNQFLSDSGLVALILDSEQVIVEGMAFSGWEAIGIEHTVTSAKGTTVYTINNEPALDVFIKYFGYYGNSDRDVATAQYPMQLKRTDGYSVLRSPLLAKEEERAIVLAGGVEEGSVFRFSVSPGFEVIDSTIAGFQEMQKGQSHDPEALLLFSCKGRHASLGPLIEDEIAGLYRCWNKPMIGFLSYGEIGCVKNGFCDFHNETCTLVTLKARH